MSQLAIASRMLTIDQSATRPFEDASVEVAAPERHGTTKTTSLALQNLRGAAIALLVAFHSFLAYLGFQKASAFPFDAPPYGWRAFPIIDLHRWFGFDIFCAWIDVYLMCLMFFLSGLFVSPGLERRGGWTFLRDRLVRLGAPFLFGVYVVMPAGLYPVYRLSANDASFSAYVRHFLALPFWPNGPMWFLWQLFVFAAFATALRRFAPGAVARLGRWSAEGRERPGRHFIAFAAVCAIAYLALALPFTPWDWAQEGPFALQLSRPLLYAVHFLAGFGIGVGGLERGLLATDGALSRQWRRWVAVAAVSFFAWMGLTALTLNDGPATPAALQIAADAAYAAAGAANVFLMMSLFLRFRAKRSATLHVLARNGYGVYLLHYIPLVWVQYALLPLPLFGAAKGLLAWGAILLIALAATIALRALPYGGWLLGEAKIFSRPASTWRERTAFALPGPRGHDRVALAEPRLPD
jgi:glucans biosynthesis protein C